MCCRRCSSNIRRRTTARMALNNTNLMNLAMAKFSQWVTEGGIEQEWDDYVKEVERTGLRRISKSCSGTWTNTSGTNDESDTATARGMAGRGPVIYGS